MIIQRFNLNLIPNQSPVVVHVNQYDTGTGRLIATLYEGNEPYSPNGTAVIQGTKPDGHGFQYTATLDGNVVTADLTEQMAPVAGDVRTQIVVTESSGVTGTFAFIIRVQPSALPSDTDMSESDYQYIEEAIREAQEAVQTAQEATETAQEAVERAEAAITETQENAEDSEAWAQGTRGGIPVEPTDPTYEHNAEYWAQYAERYAQGGLHYKASILFANIPTTGMREGDMYDITDDFTTDSRFTEGAGIKVKGGTNIAWNSDNKWDVLALPPKTTFNGRSGSILPMAGDYDSKKILLSSALHIGGETQNDVQEALEALSNDGVKSFNGRSGSILPMAGDYDSEKILLTSVLHIGGETQENAQEALEALSNDGVKSFNGRSGSVLPMAGDYSAEQVNYDSNQTVKQKIDALVTKEESDIAGQQSLVKDTVGWTGKNLADNSKTISMGGASTVFSLNDNGGFSLSGSIQYLASLTPLSNLVVGEQYNASIKVVSSTNSDARLTLRDSTNQIKASKMFGTTPGVYELPFTYQDGWYLSVICNFTATQSSMEIEEIMVRKADITDPTYEPYHESVEVMYEEEIHGVNLLKNKTGTLSYQGVTFTTDSNGYITANGLATNYAFWNIEDCLDFSKLRVGDEYILSGCPQGGSNSTYCMYIQTSADNYLMEYGQSAKFTYTGTNIIHIAVQIRKGYNANNVVFKPMLRKADIEDSTYRPYNEQAIQNQLNAQGVLGAKNLLKNTATSQTINGVTFTVNSDGSIKVNGTATANTYYNVNDSRISGDILQSGTFIMTSKAFLTASYGMYFQERNADDTAWGEGQIDTGDGIAITHNSNRNWAITIYVNSGKTASNITFYPMLRLASDPDDTYQPYAMTNRELTEKKINIADLKTVVSASSDFTDFKTRIASL